MQWKTVLRIVVAAVLTLASEYCDRKNKKRR